jgi:protein-disulfide isomerase
MMRTRRLLYICLAAAAATAAAAGYVALRQPTSGAAAAGGDGAEVLAVVNGRKITRREVDERAGSQLQGLESKLYQLRKGALDGIIGELLLEEEARKRNVSAEELKSSLVSSNVPVTEARVEEVYASQASRFGNVDEAAGKQQVREALEKTARRGNYERFVAGLRRQGGVQVLLRPPAPARVDVSSDGPSKGSSTAPLVLVEFSDFECPACKSADGLVKLLAAEYGDKLKVVYRHLPLPMHKDAFGAAQAAFCAGEQGRFWEMHDLLFQKSDGLVPDALKGYAARLGLDAGSFERCFDSEASRAAVTRDMEEARAAGLRSTPTFVLNGKLVPHPRSLAEFKEFLDLELQAVAGR